MDLSEKWSEEELLGYSFEYPAAAYRDSETHAGDDVAIFARGPGAFLFQSTHEQESKKMRFPELKSFYFRQSLFGKFSSMK